VEQRIKLEHYNSDNTILNTETAKSVKIPRCDDITYVDNIIRAHKRPLIITDHRHRYKQSDLQSYRAVQCKSNYKHSVATTASK